MNGKRRTCVALSILMSMVMVVWTPVGAAAAGDRAKVSSAAMEARLDALERQNQLLEEQNRTIQGQLSSQKSEIDILKQQLQSTAQPVANLQKEVPTLEKQIEDVGHEEPDVEFGFRVGWSESPYGMPGGVFYSVYTDHRLLSSEDGMPGGTLSGDLTTGFVQGNHTTTFGSLTTVITHQPSKGWLDTIEIEPTLQYHLEPAVLGYPSLSWLRPYVLAGPGMWINLLSTPIVNGPGPGHSYRHYSADIQGGAVLGAGTHLSLSMLKVPPIQGILDKTLVGAEWRYNQYSNGEGFNQYSGSVGFGW